MCDTGAVLFDRRGPGGPVPYTGHDGSQCDGLARIQHEIGILSNLMCSAEYGVPLGFLESVSLCPMISMRTPATACAPVEQVRGGHSPNCVACN